MSKRRRKRRMDPKAVKLFMMTKYQRAKLCGSKSDGETNKKIAKNKDDKYVDAMYYRLPGSFGTGKRR
ncbi:hypothetical protein ABNF72_11130 [Paenibacillus larvae]|uniref:hypothetical protein n=1 Tax=Paenibacillus larvae TaxID=1464 RepID=UPI00122E0537|nr:hypothetical protein [Paenibacillus larvae]MCY7518865.1 hypothetical protein [Paenibacillus larvae]MCY9500588.1 hypothetical protein [Paenibacillus larvae]MCY9565706.1 hypothetical protein [Paenibacillus larvae]MCY9568192.1 hypothetical protein [Paenibacillus larvae]MCY9571265.1 hypothetical protein [Paenibacillus larvae]